MVFTSVPAELSAKGVESLSLRGEFGRWLKARERWLSVEELHRSFKWKDDLYLEITGHLLEMLKAWGLVKPVEVKLGAQE